MFSAIGIPGKVKEFEAAFRGTNQAYKDLGNTLLAKNKTMIVVSLIINLILGVGSLIYFAVSGGSVVIPVGEHQFPVEFALSAIVLATYFITFLMLLLTGWRLKSYLGKEGIPQNPA